MFTYKAIIYTLCIFLILYLPRVFSWFASLKAQKKLINTKNMYFVPFRQDDYISKPKSLVLDYNYIVDTVYDALPAP